MVPTIKAEFRKLFTIRSTYVIMFIVLAFLALMSFYFEGYKGNTGSAASELAPTALQEIVRNSASLGSLFMAIIAVLFMAHEYRYNTITYTLTANTRRTKVFLSKMLTISAFGTLFGLVIVLLGLGFYWLGLQFRDASLPQQDFAVISQFGKVILYYVAYALIGLFVAALLRAVVGAIAVLLLVPTTIEPLLSLVLKEKTGYLPFTSIDQIIGINTFNSGLSATTVMSVATLYVGVFGIITWLLFVRRDAN